MHYLFDLCKGNMCRSMLVRVFVPQTSHGHPAPCWDAAVAQMDLDFDELPGEGWAWKTYENIMFHEVIAKKETLGFSKK